MAIPLDPEDVLTSNMFKRNFRAHFLFPMEVTGTEPKAAVRDGGMDG